MRLSFVSRKTPSHNYMSFIRFSLTYQLALIPVIATLPARHTTHQDMMGSSVLVPLYVYPSPGAWNPFYEMYVSMFSTTYSNPVKRNKL